MFAAMIGGLLDRGAKNELRLFLDDAAMLIGIGNEQGVAAGRRKGQQKEQTETSHRVIALEWPRDRRPA